MLAAPGERHGLGGAGVGGPGVHLASRPVPGLVLALQNEGDLDKLLSEIQGRWVIVEFVAGWSAACTAMRQPFEDLAQTMVESVFLHVDVDALCQDAAKFGATRVPQYCFFWNGEKEASFSGASERKLREMLRNCTELGPCPVEVTYQDRVAARQEKEERDRKAATAKAGKKLASVAARATAGLGGKNRGGGAGGDGGTPQSSASPSPDRTGTPRQGPASISPKMAKAALSAFSGSSSATGR